MAGAYKLLVSRANVTVQIGARVDAHLEGATVSVRDGLATARLPNGETQTMPVATLEKSRRSATVTGTDGTVWTVAKRGCGCGGGR